MYVMCFVGKRNDLSFLHSFFISCFQKECQPGIWGTGTKLNRNNRKGVARQVVITKAGEVEKLPDTAQRHIAR
jgi:hypothetical protein